MRAGQDGVGADPSGEGKLWLKYALSLLLSAAALLAGISGVGPWPESGFVSGLILLATGPFIALRMRSAARPGTTSAPSRRVWGRLPWLTAAVGMVELLTVLAVTASNR